MIGCSRRVDIKPFDSKNISDIESNDSIKNPKDVSSQMPIIGFFNDKKDIGDKDYYRVFFSVGHTPYEILQTAVPGIDSKITFYSSSKKMLFNIDRGGKGEPEKLWEYFPASENIIICVESKTGFNEKVPYVINFTPKIDNDIIEEEPNDDEKNAIPIKPGEEKGGLISPKSDVDYYKVIFDDESFYDFSIKVQSQSGLDVNFTLLNIDNKIDKYINEYSWGNIEYFPFLSNKKGNYIIKIKGIIKSDSFQNPAYTLIIEENLKRKIGGDEVYYEREFNDNSDMATEIIDGTSIIGVFYPENDIDWFKFDIIRMAISLNISLSRIKGLNPNIELYDKNFNMIKLSNDNGIDEGEELIINNVKRGKYYIKITSDNKSLLIYKLFLNVRY
ncbi:MAG: hypothetical protein JXA99_03730 [Candidatus Lokiarchaeota archaeon]|nr:hypothetical protein [Candidatus Lokiarchaeota archaeon]